MDLITNTSSFIRKAKNIHGDRYDYSLSDYINARTKVIIICPMHGKFEQTPRNHVQGNICYKCSFDNKIKPDYFINKAKQKHDDKYDYTKVIYKNARTKVDIVCPEHGIFQQTPKSHLQGSGCPKCSLKQKIDLSVVSLTPEESPFIDNDNNINCLCAYCGKYFIPLKQDIHNRIKALKSNDLSENRLYCSGGCKNSCSIYNQRLCPKGYKQATSREVQPQLRKLVFKRDGHTCQKCDSKDNLHCHHITGVEMNPIESADIDNCITLCKDCHKEVHKQDGCNMKRKKC